MILPYEVAKKELGVTEVPGSKNNPRIVEYHKETSLHATSDSVAWCSSFVNFCVAESIRSGYKSYPPTRSAMARSWALWGLATKDPKEGDIVVFSRGRDGVSGHVGFFIKRDPLYVWCLGGNQSDSVCISKYLRARVIAYRTI